MAELRREVLRGAPASEGEAGSQARTKKAGTATEHDALWPIFRRRPLTPRGGITSGIGLGANPRDWGVAVR